MPQEAAHDFQAHAILSDVGMPAIFPGLPDLWLAGNHMAAFQAATWRHFHLKKLLSVPTFSQVSPGPSGPVRPLAVRLFGAGLLSEKCQLCQRIPLLESDAPPKKEDAGG